MRPPRTNEHAAGGTATDGFSLIELLMVIMIIAMLAAMLLPAVGMVRESVQRTVCASNMRQWGLAALAHAADNQGTLPMTFGMAGGILYDGGATPTIWGAPYPLMMHNESEPYQGGGTAASFGTNLDTWKQYGFVEKLAHCPGVVGPNWAPKGGGVAYFSGFGFGGDTAPPGSPGTVFETEYCYIAGLADYPPVTRNNWSMWSPYTFGFAQAGNTRLLPAYRSVQRNDASRLLMTDTISIYRPLPDAQYRINHTGNNRSPRWQNLLFVDGHVEGRGGERLPALEPMPVDYQYSFASGGLNFYWSTD